MSAAKLADAGLAAVQSRKWDDAIQNLTKAIEQSKSPQWLLARSQAYMETGHLDEALRDAEFAYCTAAERGNDKSRKQMIEAQYRRSVIYARKKRYADADVCAVWSQKLAEGVAVKAAQQAALNVNEQGFYHATAADAAVPKKDAITDSTDSFSKISAIMGGGDDKKPYQKDWDKAQTWRLTILNFLGKLPAEDPARKLSVKMAPNKPSLEDMEKQKQPDPEIEAAKQAAASVQAKPRVENVDGPFRSQMYQSDSTMTATFFMKFASKEDAQNVQVDIQPNLITVTGVPRKLSTMYIVPHAAIDPAKSTYRVAPIKIEFTLFKAQPGKWPSFGREEPTKPDDSVLPQFTQLAATPPVATAAAAASQPMGKPKGPAYPTSAKSGPKNWDKLEDDEDKDKEPGDVDGFFKALYAGATPDQQRAMMKSFQESNGTALSTDWNTVSKETVKTSPPDGVEVKKY